MKLFIILSLAAAAVAAPVNDSELLFVTFVHRHGDRSPMGSYHNDPYGNESMWNNGWGELTNAGKQRAFGFGKWLRERYAGFLPKTYHKEDYEVQSTDVRRALMSASLVLAGLYEPTGNDVWNPNLVWQPIPVHTVPLSMDNVLLMGKPCSKHQSLMVELMLSQEILSRIEPFAQQMSEIVKHAGYHGSNMLSNFRTTTMIYDSLKVQKENGFSLPEWTKPYFPQPMQKLNSLMLTLPSFNKALQRFFCGLLVKDILQHFQSKAMGVLTNKMWQYSAHDITVAGLKQCLGLENETEIPYAAALILELIRKDGEHYVRTLFKGEKTLETQVIPGCAELCPLAKFKELVTPVIPKNWDKECEFE